MKKSLLLAGAILLLAVPAMAGGVNMTWGAGCWTDLHSDLETFACTSNSGTHILNISYMVDVDIPDFVGIGVYLTAQQESAHGMEILVPWWQLDSGQCRPTPTASSDYTAYNTVCTDIFAGAAAGGLGAYQDYLSTPMPTDQATMNGFFAMADPVDLGPGVEYYGCRFNIGSTKTVGSPSCAGCLQAVSWTLDQVLVSGLSVEIPLTTAIAGGNKVCYWQHKPITGTEKPTWGQVKALYR